MKKLLFGLLVLGSISAFAENTCKTWKSDGPYSIAICAENLILTENGTRLEGLYLRSAYGAHGISKSTSKSSVCKKMGFGSFVRGSEVIEKHRTSVVRGEQAIIKTAKIITALECI